ncbi:MAG TPA: hypothetical protein VGH74_02885 [Planctomycetaceae bacterium]
MPTVTGRMLRVVIVLSLWHAPIPWVHVHEFEGPRVDRLESLSRHIAEFHAGDLLWGTTAAEWHSHLVLPWCLNHRCPHDQHNCPADDERDPGSDDILAGGRLTAGDLTAGQSFGPPTSRAWLAGEFMAAEAPLVQRGTGANNALCGLSRFRQFFETYGSSVAVRDLLSVRLC